MATKSDYLAAGIVLCLTIGIIVGVFVALAAIVIWAFNTIFSLHIAYSFIDIFAVIVLMIILRLLVG